MGGFIDQLMSRPVLEAVQRLRPLAAQAGCRSWRSRGCCVGTTSPRRSWGASRSERVHANASASAVRLSADTLAAIDDALGEVAVR